MMLAQFSSVLVSKKVLSISFKSRAESFSCGILHSIHITTKRGVYKQTHQIQVGENAVGITLKLGRIKLK